MSFMKSSMINNLSSLLIYSIKEEKQETFYKVDNKNTLV
jgi:hypothetical protein